jgi:hypothetical protein
MLFSLLSIPKHLTKGPFPSTSTSPKGTLKWEITDYSTFQTDVQTLAMSVMDIATTLWHENLHRIRFNLLEPISRTRVSPYQEQRVLPTPNLLYNHQQAQDSSPR